MSETQRGRPPREDGASPEPEVAGVTEDLGLPPPAAASFGAADESAPPSPPSRDADETGLVRTFVPGQVIADRYAIVSFIAEGAMGEVYHARDTALQADVALKTVHPEIARDEKALRRFTREIQVARSVTHPNVCRIFDLGWHRPPEDPARQVMFLTMELLRGQSLSQRLRRGRMDPAEALPIAEQMAAGLYAAHRAGVIHRDFKSANVVLVPAAGGEVRAVVTDFGLARSYEGGGPEASITDTGLISGTPAYMAPEQVQGGPLTPAADIYALGIVLYEMVTGVRPFDGGSAMSVALRRLTEPPPPPRVHRPDIPARWEAVILHCLERDSSARFPSAAEVARALTSDSPIARPDTPTLTKPDRPAASRPWLAVGRRRDLFVGAAALAIAGALAGHVATRRGAHPPAAGMPSPSPAAPTVKPRRSVAVLGVKNTTGQPDAAWLETALAEMLATDLGIDGKVRMVPGHEVAAARADLGLASGDSLDRASLDKVRRRLGADVVVAGSYTVVGEGESRIIRVDLRLQDASTGEVIGTSRASGTEGQLFDLVARAGALLRERLGLGALSSADALRLETVLPPHRGAARLYSQGIARLRGLELAEARDSLREAVRLEPKHALSHAALSSALAALGDDTRARASARKAVDLAGALPLDQKMSVEAQLHEANADWEKAATAYRSLFEQFPDDVEHGLRLADALTAAGRAKEAMVVIESLRRLPPALSGDPRIDLSLARAQQKLSDYKAQQATAEAAAGKAAALGARGLAARARLLEASAFSYLGDPARTYESADAARVLFEAIGDRGGAARAVENMAFSMYERGDLDGARRLFERAREAHRAVGNEMGAARVLHNLGRVHLDLGEAALAERSYEEAFASFQRIGARWEMAAALNEAGVALYGRGELDRAQRRYQEALAAFSELGDKRHTANAITNVAEILLIKGDLVQAEDMLKEALAAHREIGDRDSAAYDLFRLGDVASARGDLRVAREKYGEALAGQAAGRDRLAAAATRVSMARLEVAEGRPADGEKLAREAEEVFRTEGLAEGEIAANVALAEALLAQGRAAAARDPAARAQAMAEKAGYRRMTAGSAAILARVTTAEGHAERAIELVNRVLPEARRSSFAAEVFELRLALGEARMRTSKAAGAAALKAVASEAAARGLQLIARRAATLGEGR